MGILNPVDNKYNFQPDKDIPDLSGKVIIVTGGNNGIGKATVVALAKHNAGRIYLAARSKAKYDDAMASVREAAPGAKVEFLELDLASFASIKRAADQVIASNDRLDILINNAGVMALPPAQTVEGYEIQFGTNHMGHALLTKLLLPLLLKTAELSDVRIVNVTSTGYMLAPKGTFLPDQVRTSMSDFHTYVRYGQSKMANVLHGRELARRYPQILSTSVHPGRVATPLLDHMMTNHSFTTYFQKFFDALAGKLTPEMGACNTLWCSTWKREDVQNGGFYTPIGKLDAGEKRSQEVEMAKKLWDWQEEEFRQHGYA
ncbi:hypothetical protein A1O3_03889 [Capronia epimyces CBS 606.96]|uniref:Oxidoreductase n=1 Tax=Capronia epimyces CBS 606.96 TaxID=1182542 RepID=W9YBC5_9EURO|nr:uncharacterized protein A1O3_03889 [Capronia epimyces CBS 606.96]EXJ86935.1 hypothetical protein A1O3_03889 [Capronia epimyces CBS 606.96]